MNLDHLTIDTQPDSQDVKYLEDQINHFNVVTTGITDGGLVSIFLRNEHNEIIAGIFGWTWGGTCEVRHVWVHESLRGRGLGKKLLLTVEDEAVKRGCHQVVLQTHSFQAPSFYQKLGYEIIGMHDNYPLNYQQYYLCKTLRWQ